MVAVEVVTPVESVVVEAAGSGYRTKEPSFATFTVFTAVWRDPSVLTVSAVTWTLIWPLLSTLLLMLLVSTWPLIVPVFDTS